ncbi:MAG: nitroreductase family protein [Chloroflexi bacterium]|nr:nitroreductase family protein [Chloroflexota bacterium]
MDADQPAAADLVQDQPSTPGIELMRAHRSVRSFRADPLPAGWVETIVSAAQWASSSSFRQAYSVIAVKDPQTKAALRPLCGNQHWVEECPIFLAFCADLNRAGHICAGRGFEANLEFTDTLLTAVIDAALVMQNAALAAESLGLGMVMIGALRDHPREASRLLDLPRGVFAIAGMCLGFPAKIPAQRPRLPLEETLHWEHYNSQGRQERLEAYDQRIRAERIYKKKDEDQAEGWTEVMARAASQPPPEDRRLWVEFLRQQGFGVK